MAESDASRGDRLPIKLVLPKQGREKRVSGGGSAPVPFRQVDSDYRRSLVREISAIRETVFPQTRVSAAPVRVKLLTKAAAKSHRPESLFNSSTCPIVGAGRLGELFVKATPAGLTRLSRAIESGVSDRLIKEISCIEAIEAVTPSYRRRGLDATDVLRRSPRGKEGFVTRVRLFSFGKDVAQDELVAEFAQACHDRDITVTRGGYAPGSFTFGAECRTAEDVEILSKLISVRSITSMPLVRTLRPKMFNAKALPPLTRRSDVAGDVPVVVIVDSGISSDLPHLEEWVVGRESSVAPAYRNTEHGTFVAGLVCWGAELNPTITSIDGGPCGLFDLQVIPNDDPSKGATDAIGEQELLVSLDTALQQHANEYKVWNLSLGTDTVCSLDDFSEFAVELDNLQEKYQVSFVISAGNFSVPPLLDFPRKKAHLATGRITTPADSVLGIAVGAVSHVGYAKNGPKLHEPSPFSRHGAGPNYVIKPDLVHYGGSCTTDALHINGVRSINTAGTAENLGTSFAAPLVSRSLAQVYHQITPTPTPVLARALLTHHARDPRNLERVPDGEENFFGFGVPAPVPYCLECTPFTSTLVFEDVLRPGYFLEWDNFPYPNSLKRNGRFFGEVWMTVAFAPARGSRWGSEYCETHIDAHFGVYRQHKSRHTGEIKSVFVGLVPPEHKNPGQLYESYQVAHLRKWAPVRTYHGDLGKNGKLGDRWRLKVQLLARHGIDDGEALKAQPFSLIITIADPKKKAPVYDEMARIIANTFQSQNLALRAATRIRGRS